MSLGVGKRDGGHVSEPSPRLAWYFSFHANSLASRCFNNRCCNSGEAGRYGCFSTPGKSSYILFPSQRKGARKFPAPYVLYCLASHKLKDNVSIVYRRSFVEQKLFQIIYHSIKVNNGAVSCLPKGVKFSFLFAIVPCIIDSIHDTALKTASRLISGTCLLSPR